MRCSILALAMLSVLSATALQAATVKLWRLDCGSIEDDLDYYSDTYAYVGKKGRLVASCYLIQHDDTYMLWDTGLADQQTLPAQLAALGMGPEKVAILGISHYHYDHTGQAALFPKARLLIGREDVTALREPRREDDAKPLAHWLKGEGQLEPVSGDKDIYGDQTVVMLELPGHTPGHHGLLVKLARKGYVLLSGDVAHTSENYETNGVPRFNTDRAQSLASLDRVKGIVKNVHATLIIQHEVRDVAKLPKFPAFAD